MECLPSKNDSLEIPWNVLQKEDISHTDKPIVGNEFLIKFLQTYEMEEDVQMLLEMPANGEEELAGRNDQATSPGLVFFEVSNVKLDDQMGEKASLVSERDQSGVCGSRAEKILRKTHHHTRKEVYLPHKKKRRFLKMLYETMEEVKSCEELVSRMLHLLK